MLKHLTVNLVVILILALVVANLVWTARSSRDSTEEKLRITSMAQEILDEIRDTMIGSVAVFKRPKSSSIETNGDDGNVGARQSWLRRLELPANAAPIPFTRLPRLTTTGPHGKELVAGGRTGNALLFAKPLREVRLRTRQGGEFEIRTYELLCYYLSKVGNGPSESMPGGLTLCRYVSAQLADAAQIEAIRDESERTDIVRGLAEGRGGRAIAWAWRHHADPQKSLLRIDAATGRLVEGAILPADPQRSRWSMLPTERYAVASNYAAESTGVGRFGQKSDDSGGFPHGFEVQLAGAASTRQVMVHLTLTSADVDAPRANADLQAIVLVKDR